MNGGSIRAKRYMAMVLDQEALLKQAPMEIEQLIQMAEQAPEPGMPGRTSVNHGEFTQDSEAALLRGAGWAYVYDTITRVRSTTVYNLLPSLLRLKREDGSPYYTTATPKEPPISGTHKCMLHAEHPNRALYDGMGLEACRKSNIKNDYEVMMHMKRKHGNIWEALERTKEEKRYDEDREFQREMLGRLINSGAVATGPGAEEPKAEMPLLPDEVVIGDLYPDLSQPHVEERDGKKRYTYFCQAADCERNFESTAAAAATRMLKAHVRREHPADA